jgi:hypothetical protein
MGSETTSPYWYTIGDWMYMTLIVQHPYGVSSIHAATSSEWQPRLAENPLGRLCDPGTALCCIASLHMSVDDVLHAGMTP